MSVTLNSIPASEIVSVTPSVIGAGGTELSLIELMLTTSWRVPLGTAGAPIALSFPTADAVGDYFGATSQEADEATVYFNGWTGSTKKPGALLFAQYPEDDVGAWLRTGVVSGLSLTQLQAISGVLTITIDGTPTTSASIDLSSATSLSNAAQLISNGLALFGPEQAEVTARFGGSFTATGTGTSFVVTSVTGTIHPGTAATASVSGTGVPADTWIVAQVSGTPGGAGTYTTNQATTASSASITLTSNYMDVSAVASGTLAVGQQIDDAGSGITAGTYITALGTGTGGTGSYVTTKTQGFASATVTAYTPVVTYDGTWGSFVTVSATVGVASTIGYGSGTISTALKFTQAAGAVISQGADATTPEAFMDGITSYTQDWATFQTLFDPDVSGNTIKLEFAAWTNGTNNRYAYLCWDTDPTPTESSAATTSVGYILRASDSSGTVPIYEPEGEDGTFNVAFVGGMIASIDFNQTNGRATAAFKTQTGLTAQVTDATAASNLIVNGYNYLGAYATAADRFQFLYPGQITGPFQWVDSYVNQIWLNNACQLALMTMLTTYRSIPYNPTGYGYIRAALQDPINAAVNFGAIRQNVPLSAAQISEVNAAAGLTVDRQLSTEGWVLVIQAASAIVRAARGSPTIILFYMDGQSVQSINLSSVLVQ